MISPSSFISGSSWRGGLLTFAGLTTLLLAVPAASQEPASPFGHGSHCLRGILKHRFQIEPLTRAEFEIEMVKRPSAILLIVLGDPAYLDQLGGDKLTQFIGQGGALLAATDRKTDGALARAFRVGVSGEFFRVPAGSPAAWRQEGECPLVQDFAGPKRHPVLRGIREVATNRPSDIVVAPGRRLRPVAWLPGDAVPERGRPSPPNEFAAAGEFVGNGRVLLIADHSVFINDMMLQPTLDNDNFFFTCNCIDWLTDGGRQRTHALLIEDGRVVSDFNVSFKELPPLPFPENLPLPPEGVLVDKAEELLVRVEESDFLDRLLAPFFDRWYGVILRILAVVATLMLVAFALVRLLSSRHRWDRNEPLLAVSLARQGIPGNVHRYRNDMLARQNNWWEPAQQLARQFFAAAGQLPAEEGTVSKPPAIQAGWWQQRSLARKIDRLWHIAVDPEPRPISAAEFRRFQNDLRDAQAAFADGSLRFG